MRVAADSQLLEVQPGDRTFVTVEVVNTGQVIDGVTARVLGIPAECVTAQPQLLPLFPESSGQVRLDLAVPASHPAGRHPLTVEVVSHGTHGPSSFIDIDLDVAARPDLRVVPAPRVVRARRNARFVIEISNDGNVPLDVELSGADPDRQAQLTFSPARRRIEPGTVAAILLLVRGPRMFTGAEVDRPIAVEVTATPLYVPSEPLTVRELPTEFEAEPLPVAALPPLVREANVALRQRPIIGRGLLTILILMSIVAVWAAVFLLGLGKVFSGDPMTKEAPASFFATAAGTGGASGSAGGGGGAGSAAAAGAGAPPAGALSKSGQLPPGMGGAITGKVIASSDAQPVGRILVQAYRTGRSGLVRVSSAATQADGTYTLAGLFPTNYLLQFSANGYRTMWYPNDPSAAAAQQIAAVAQGTTSGINQTIVGNPATISGSVDPGDTLTPVITVVTARELLGTQTGKPAAVTTTNAAGGYTLSNLPAPSSYELTFTTPGYTATTVVDSVGGGDNRLEPAVRLGTTTGRISGVVRDASAPIGGASISTTVAGKPLNVITPTTGQVGAFILDNLPTPATYVITVSAPNHGTTTTIIDLAAGQSRAGVDVDIAAGTGSVTGKVVGPNGQGLGGVTVTVGGAAVAAGGAAPSATTLTAGSPGSFAINGLAVPGSYTLTASLNGYAAASVPITLIANGSAPTVTIRLASQLGSIAGVITSPSGPFAGATVTATNGLQAFTTTSESGDGGFLLANLPPGSYSLTATVAGESQQTALVEVTAGGTARQNLEVGT